MARLDGFKLLGALGTMTAYKRKDLDKIIARTKGGPSKERISTDPNFEATRNNNQEFGGRSTATSSIRQSIIAMKPLMDYNIAGPLNALLKSIQEKDTENDFGSRCIELSRCPALLEGFPLNKRNVFESVVRGSLRCELNKEALTATLEIPELLPGTNFFPVDAYPFYRWQVCLSLIPDFYHQPGKKYQSPRAYITIDKKGEWHAVGKAVAAQTIEMALPAFPGEGAYSLMLTVGIGFGTVRQSDPEQVDYAGSGKVLRVV